MTSSSHPPGAEPAASPHPRFGGLGGKLALSFASLVALALLLELLLQIASFVMREEPRWKSEALPGAAVRIVAIGDSNTFGLYYERELAYPHVLQEAWNAGGSSPKIEVINFGIPGANSSRVLSNLERIFDTFEPHLLLVQLGANDYWMPRVPVDGPKERRFSTAGWIRRHSRLYTFLHILRRSFFDPDHLEIEYSLDGNIRYRGQAFEMGVGIDDPYLEGLFPVADVPVELGVGLDDENRPNKARVPSPSDVDLVNNLTAMAARARARNVELVFLTYPSHLHLYGRANAQMREVARSEGLPLIEVAAVFLPLCPKGQCPDYLHPDQHATWKGYELVARLVQEQLARLLELP